MILSENFKAQEFVVSDSRPDLAAKIMLSDADIQNLLLLCKFALQPIRNVFGPVTILSGKRSQELNAAVGGRTDSQHLRAMAVDFTMTKPMSDVFLFCKHDLRWPGELIHYISKNFIHLALPEVGIKSDVMVK